MRRFPTFLTILVSALLAVMGPVVAAGSGSTGFDPTVLRTRLEQLSHETKPTIAGAPIGAIPVLLPYYERNAWEPVWLDPSRSRALLTLVQGSVADGLDPEDFHASTIAAWLDPGERSDDPSFLADREILFGDALARLVVTLHFGELDPAKLDPAWNFRRKFGSEDPVDVLNGILLSSDLARTVQDFAPRIRYYTTLKQALARYRTIEEAGGWPTIGGGKTLKPGMTDPRVTVLRARLRATGDLEGDEPEDPSHFDDAVEAAVKTFQSRHGIDADGKVGPRTLQELDVPVANRIDQIRANLERARWVFREIPKDFVLVDIAGYRLHLVKDGREVWVTRVQVGKPHHSTPVFRSMLKYVVFNPTWTIPPGILRRETLPRLLKDPIPYLRQRNMSIVTYSGKVVDPATVDWDAARKGHFPYMVRQEPGPDNALGRVKFLFPNPYMVYLHDTPSKARFGRTERAFSHGCIRTQHPLELARLLLEDQGWNRQRIDNVLATKKTAQISIKPPIPVMLLYWTVEVMPDGTIDFRKDLYGRDRKIIEGLDTPYLVQPPPDAVPGRGDTP